MTGNHCNYYSFGVLLMAAFKLKGGVTMTDEGILFCFSMLFLALYLLGSC